MTSLLAYFNDKVIA